MEVHIAYELPSKCNDTQLKCDIFYVDYPQYIIVWQSLKHEKEINKSLLLDSYFHGANRYAINTLALQWRIALIQTSLDKVSAGHSCFKIARPAINLANILIGCLWTAYYRPGYGRPKIAHGFYHTETDNWRSSTRH